MSYNCLFEIICHVIQIHEIARMRPQNSPSDYVNLTEFFSNRIICIMKAKRDQMWPILSHFAIESCKCTHTHTRRAVCVSRAGYLQVKKTSVNTGIINQKTDFSSEGAESRSWAPISRNNQAVPYFHRWINRRDNFQKTMVLAPPKYGGSVNLPFKPILGFEHRSPPHGIFLLLH